ncbi:MAG: FAD-dependent oxidoreductase [Erysipelotrichaceae bacterium]|nr:FAD-dependent oxidoreductase [Erysipelotrichaceae bacterium]
MFDMIVIGGGPAGLSAAVYGLRNGKSVLIIEKSVFGGQIVNSPKVENIPGFTSISGDVFADKFLDQAMAQGAEVTLEEVMDVKKENIFYVQTLEGNTYQGKSVIIATGTTHRLLGLEHEEDLIGDGISFCAVCDGDFYKDQTVVMIGGGNSAFVEANLLVDIVKELILLQDMPFFTADQKSQDQLFAHPNVTAHVNTKVLGYELTDGRLTGVRYEQAGKEQIVSCDGVFLAVGLVPDNGIFKELTNLDASGYIQADEACLTKTPGLFVAGDCRTKSLRQVATACADGAMAAIAACSYLKQ